MPRREGALDLPLPSWLEQVQVLKVPVRERRSEWVGIHGVSGVETIHTPGKPALTDSRLFTIGFLNGICGI